MKTKEIRRVKFIEKVFYNPIKQGLFFDNIINCRRVEYRYNKFIISLNYWYGFYDIKIYYENYINKVFEYKSKDYIDITSVIKNTIQNPNLL